jgi:hypothetical protein
MQVANMSKLIRFIGYSIFNVEETIFGVRSVAIFSRRILDPLYHSRRQGNWTANFPK